MPDPLGRRERLMLRLAGLPLEDREEIIGHRLDGLTLHAVTTGGRKVAIGLTGAWRLVSGPSFPDPCSIWPDGRQCCRPNLSPCLGPVPGRVVSIRAGRVHLGPIDRSDR